MSKFDASKVNWNNVVSELDAKYYDFAEQRISNDDILSFIKSTSTAGIVYTPDGEKKIEDRSRNEFDKFFVEVSNEMTKELRVILWRDYKKYMTANEVEMFSIPRMPMPHFNYAVDCLGKANCIIGGGSCWSSECC